MTRSVRRWGALVASTALALSLSACGDGKSADGTTEDAVPQAATEGVAWLTGQLEHGVLVNHQYQTNDDSTTVELAYALRALDPSSPALTAIGEALAKDATTYSHPDKKTLYSGATAKLLSFATDTGADPTSFGGLDLVTQMESLTAPSGRIGDVSTYGDYANSFGQTWAVRGLLNARSKEAPAAEGFLLQQQCADGFFRQDFSKPTAKDQSCASGDPASVDTTALVVVLLQDKSKDDKGLTAAIDKAVAWLKLHQAKDGSFVANVGGTPSGPNADSTGLAAAALRIAGDDADAAKAATWVRAHQVASSCDGRLAGEAGAIAYDDTTLAQGVKAGITAKTAYTWRLASAQALPALLSLPADAPAATCPSTK